MSQIYPEFLDGVLADCKKEAPSDAVRSKLDILHEACGALAKARIHLTVAAVLTEYARLSKGAGSMAESSLRNKREGRNPYNKLFLAWSKWTKSGLKSSSAPGEWILPVELASIPNEQLRHRIALMAADAQSLRSQLAILQKADSDHLIRIEGSIPVIDDAKAPSTCIDPEDLEALQDFLDARRLKARGLALREDGALLGPSGGVVADPGFFDALKKVVEDSRP